MLGIRILFDSPAAELRRYADQTRNDKVNDHALRVPFIVVCAGCAGLVLTAVAAARTDATNFASAIVFQWILGFGMMVSGLLLIGGAIGANRLVFHAAVIGVRRNAWFFRVTGAIGVIATLYGAAVYFGL